MKDTIRIVFSLTALAITSGLVVTGFFGLGPFLWDTGATYALVTAYGCLEVLMHSIPGPFAGRPEWLIENKNALASFPATKEILRAA